MMLCALSFSNVFS